MLGESQSHDYDQMKPDCRIPASTLQLPSSSPSSRPITPPAPYVSESRPPSLVSSTSRWTTFDVDLSQPNTETILFHMNRNSNEAATKAFQRIGFSIAKRALPKEKGKKKTARQDVSYTLWTRSNDEDDDEDRKELDVQELRLCDVWTHDQFAGASRTVLSLGVDGTTIDLDIDFCPPTIASVLTYEAFSARLFVGVPVTVNVELYFAKHCRVDWFVNDDHVGSDNNHSFTPTAQHVGKTLSIRIAPYRANHDGSGLEEAYRFQHVVEERPYNALLGLRPEWLVPRESLVGDRRCLRVLSYNILADTNAFSDVAQTSFYPYCDLETLDRQRRMPLVLHEILAYRADVVCLQEVDTSVFRKLLKPALNNAGYQGFFGAKDNSGEGCAVFWSLQTFEPAKTDQMKSTMIRDLFCTEATEEPMEDWDSMRDIHDLLKGHDELRRVLLEKLGHVLQTVTLTLRGGSESIVVGNTHLFFHPCADHIRMLQLYACLHRLERERHQEKTQHPLVLCGDLNSSPRSGAARLLFDRTVSPTLGITRRETWKHLDTFTWERTYTEAPQTATTPPTISLPATFPTIVSGYTETPDFTHFVNRFSSTLDYILCSSDHFLPRACGPMPTREMIEKDVGMPSKQFPSDHVSLVCDLELLDKP